MKSTGCHVSTLLRVGAALAGALLLASCSAAPVAQTCSREDVASMGPENHFRVSIGPDAARTLDDDRDRIDVAFTIVPPLDGPVALIHSVDGREVAHWELKAGPGSGISTRCRIAMTPAQSTCGSIILGPPHSTAGDWSIDPRGNRVLEAGLAFRTCR